MWNFSRCVCLHRWMVRSPAAQPCRASLCSVLAKCSLSHPKENPWKAGGEFRDVRRSRAPCLLCAHITQLLMLRLKHLTIPQKLALRQTLRPVKSIPVMLLSTICVGERMEMRKG